MQCRSAGELLTAGRKEAKCRNCFHRPHGIPGSGEKCRGCGCDDYAEAPRPLSIPMQRLLAQVKGKEPEIAMAMREKKTQL